MQNMSIKRQHSFAAGIFIIALAVFYRDVVFYGRTFLMESTVSWTTPQGLITIREYNPVLYPRMLEQLHGKASHTINLSQIP